MLTCSFYEDVKNHETVFLTIGEVGLKSFISVLQPYDKKRRRK
jgi:hypothetical protein